jgi:lysophospholipase L1-like esterase
MGRGANLIPQCLLTVDPVGDSITQGAGTNPGDTTRNTGYRFPVWNALQAAGINVRLNGQQSANHDANVVQVFHDGFSGDTIAQIKARVLNSIPALYPEVVLLHAGTNDIQAATPANTIITALDDLILTIWNLGQRPGFNRLKLIEVAVLCDVHIGKAITPVVNAAIPGLCAAHYAAGRNVLAVDMYNTLGPNPGPNFNGASQPHPNETGYQLMAKQWIGQPGSGLLCDWGR